MQQKVKVISTQVLNNFFSASDIMEAVRGRFHFYGINYKGCVIQVVLLRNKWVEQLLVYFYNTAVENNFLIITSFSDFILSYNSKNRHLEFLNLSPQGLISSSLDNSEGMTIFGRNDTNTEEMTKIRKE